jgi:AcrR family transcriptional regulator
LNLRRIDANHWEKAMLTITDAGPHRPAHKQNHFGRAARQVDAARKVDLVTKQPNAPQSPTLKDVPPGEMIEVIRAAASRALDAYMLEHVADAADAEDLLDRLDLILDDDVYEQRWSTLLDLLGEPLQEVVQGQDVPVPSFLSVLTTERPDLAMLIEHGHKLFRAGLAACLQSNAWVAAEREKRGETAPAKPLRTSDWVSGTWIPLLVRKAWLAKELSDVALDALLAFQTGAKAPPAWMVERLLATWVDGSQQWLNYLVGMPGVDISTLADSTKVVTMAEAISLANTAELGYQARLAEARKVEGWHPAPELKDGDRS